MKTRSSLSSISSLIELNNTFSINQNNLTKQKHVCQCSPFNKIDKNQFDFTQLLLAIVACSPFPKSPSSVTLVTEYQLQYPCYLIDENQSDVTQLLLPIVTCSPFPESPSSVTLVSEDPLQYACQPNSIVNCTYIRLLKGQNSKSPYNEGPVRDALTKLGL